MANSDYVKR